MIERERPCVAVVGSSVAGDILPAFTPEEVQAAARDVGKVLSEEGFRLLVFTSDERFIAPFVVEGYLSVPGVSKGSVIDGASVNYPTGYSQIFESYAESGVFLRHPDHHTDWEIGFFQSLKQQADALFLIGGGNSALAAAMSCIAEEKPIYCVPCFGGAASVAWKYLSTAGSPVLSPEDLVSMGAHCPRNGGDVAGLLRKQIFVQAHASHVGVQSVKNKLPEVFLVHGRNESHREATARFLEKLSLKPIILFEQPSRGRTIIEKFENYAAVEYAVILLSADDQGGERSGEPLTQSLRARQNVIFELGFFVGALGRDRVCLLYEDGVELPSDLSGVVYIKIDRGGAWAISLAKEIKASGIDIDMNRVLA